MTDEISFYKPYIWWKNYFYYRSFRFRWCIQKLFLSYDFFFLFLKILLLLIAAFHCWENFQLNFNRFWVLVLSLPLNTHLCLSQFSPLGWIILCTRLLLAAAWKLCLKFLVSTTRLQYCGPVAHINGKRVKNTTFWREFLFHILCFGETFPLNTSLAVLHSAHSGWEALSLRVQVSDPLLIGGKAVVKLKSNLSEVCGLHGLICLISSRTNSQFRKCVNTSGINSINVVMTYYVD